MGSRYDCKSLVDPEAFSMKNPEMTVQMLNTCNVTTHLDSNLNVIKSLIYESKDFEKPSFFMCAAL